MVNTCDMFPSTPMERMQESIAEIKNFVSQFDHKANYERFCSNTERYQYYLETNVRPKYSFFDAVKRIGDERAVDWGVALDMYRFENDVEISKSVRESFLHDVNPQYY